MNERFRVRWWHFTVVFVVLTVATLVALAFAERAQGRGLYAEACATLKAQGRPSNLDEFVATAPPVDPKLQDDWDVWQKACIAGNDNLSSALGPHLNNWDSWVVGRGEKPIKVDEIITAQTVRFSSALTILRKGGLVLSAWGWITTDLPTRKRRMPFASAVRLPNLSAVRELAVWLHHATVLADDPREHLADLDALHQAMARPGTLIDSMIAIVVDGIRDRTYGDLMLRRRLPLDAQLRWLQESGRSLDLVADGFEGEQSLMPMAMAASLDRDGMPSFFGGSAWNTANLDLWMHGHRDCAVMIEIESHVIQRLRQERTDLWPTWSDIEPRVGRLGKICIPNLTEAVITGLQADAGHRQSRLAVQVIAITREHGLPQDQTSLIPLLGPDAQLRPMGDHLHLRYEVPAPGRFRVTIDPASPVPNFDDPGRLSKRAKLAGAPPAKKPLIWQHGGDGNCIEIQLSTNDGKP